MNNDVLLFFRWFFAGMFVLTLLVGAYLVKNFQKLFGMDPDMPSEGGSSRAYTRVQVFLVWAHFFVLTGSFALLMH
jgi:uncharacterized membrane protein